MSLDFGDLLLHIKYICTQSLILYAAVSVVALFSLAFDFQYHYQTLAVQFRLIAQTTTYTLTTPNETLNK